MSKIDITEVKENNKYEIITSTGEKLDLSLHIVKQLAGSQNISPEEFINFFQLCKVQKLNPFLKEAYIIKYSADAPAQLVVDYKILQQRAEKDKNFDGMSKGIIIINKDGGIVNRTGQCKHPDDTLIGGWAKVYRKNQTYPVETTINLSEFDKKRSQWKEKQAFMIEKVAKTHALREAFPSLTSGMYIEEELDPINNKVETKSQPDQFESEDSIEPKFEETKVEEKPTFEPNFKKVETKPVEDVPPINKEMPDNIFEPEEDVNIKKPVEKISKETELPPVEEPKSNFKITFIKLLGTKPNWDKQKVAEYFHLDKSAPDKAYEYCLQAIEKDMDKLDTLFIKK